MKKNLLFLAALTLSIGLWASNKTVTTGLTPVLDIEVQEEADVPAITYDFTIGYTGGVGNFDTSMVHDAIGCFASNAVVYGFNPITEEAIQGAMSTYDGWFSASGVPTTFGSTTPFCIKVWNDGTFGYFTHPDVVVYGAHYTCAWLLVNPATGDAVQYNFSLNDIVRTPSCLCFTADTAGSTISLDKVGLPTDVDFETSADSLSWSDYTIGTSITLVNAGDKVYFRKKTSGVAAGLSTGTNDYYKFVMSGSIAASGNVMSLVDKSCQTSTIPCKFCFSNLFHNCASLTTAPELPATTLDTCCYQYMFYGCTALTTAPALPAAAMVCNCYQYMFQSCTTLTAAPALPATTLATGCYRDLFYNCTSLATAPELPATTLADLCYTYMFYGCTSLATAPALPATTLASNCYQNMFNHCSALTAAPALPATTLDAGCYQSMFANCATLTTVPALPADTLAKNCYQGMFMNCDSLTTPPALPATTMDTNCYQSMFMGCDNLTSLPALPATTLADNCYRGMFYGCTALQVNTAAPGAEWSIPAGATGGTNATAQMFSGTGGNFTGDPTPGTTYYIASAPQEQTPILIDETHSYTQGFENGLAGWTLRSTNTINTGGEYGRVSTSSYPACNHTSGGSYGVGLQSHSTTTSTTCSQYLFSPELNCTEPIAVTFWVQRGYGGDYLAVGYTTSDTAGMTWTSGAPEMTWYGVGFYGANAWEQKTVTFPAGTKYFGFRYGATWNGIHVFFDDIDVHRAYTMSVVCDSADLGALTSHVVATNSRVLSRSNGTNLCGMDDILDSAEVYTYRIVPAASGRLRHLYLTDSSNVTVDRIADTVFNAADRSSLFSDTIFGNSTIHPVFDTLCTLAFSSNDNAGGLLSYVTADSTYNNPFDTIFYLDSATNIHVEVITVHGTILSQLLVNGQPAVPAIDSAFYPAMLRYMYDITFAGTTRIEAVYAPDSVMVLIGANDQALGTTNPAQGYYKYAVGDTVAAACEAVGHAKFIGWRCFAASGNGDTVWTYGDTAFSRIVGTDLIGDTLVAEANFRTPDTAYLVVRNQYEALGHAMLNYHDGDTLAIPEDSTVTISVDTQVDGVRFLSFEYWKDVTGAFHATNFNSEFTFTATSDNVNNRYIVNVLFEYVPLNVMANVAAGCAGLGQAAVVHANGEPITNDNPVTLQNPDVAFVAAPADTAQFVGWDNGDEIFDSAVVRMTVTSDTALTAYFATKIAIDPVTIDPETGDTVSFFQVAADGYCQDEYGDINFTVAAGQADQYMVEFTSSQFTDVDWTDLTDPTSISIMVPSDATDGVKVAKIKFRTIVVTASGDTAYAETDYLYVAFKVNLSKDYIRVVFDDVLAVDNTGNGFATYQWYRNGEPIIGATKGYYQEVGGLKGDAYYVRMNVNTDTMARTCEFIAPVTPVDEKVLAVYPNPVSSSSTIVLRGFDASNHLLRVFNEFGVEVMSQEFSGSELKADFGRLSQGSYMVTVDGVSTKVVKY